MTGIRINYPYYTEYQWTCYLWKCEKYQKNLRICDTGEKTKISQFLRSIDCSRNRFPFEDDSSVTPSVFIPRKRIWYLREPNLPNDPPYASAFLFLSLVSKDHEERGIFNVVLIPWELPEFHVPHPRDYGPAWMSG